MPDGSFGTSGTRLGEMNIVEVFMNCRLSKLGVVPGAEVLGVIFKENTS